jgi:hypothetical protein
MDMPSRRLAIEAFSVDFMACSRTWAEDHKLGDKEHHHGANAPPGDTTPLP